MGVIEKILHWMQDSDALQVVFTLLVGPIMLDKINFRTTVIATSLSKTVHHCLSVLSSVAKPLNSFETSFPGFLRFNFDTPASWDVASALSVNYVRTKGLPTMGLEPSCSPSNDLRLVGLISVGRDLCKMVKDSCKNEYLLAKWMQAGRQHKRLEHIPKFYIKK